MARMDSPKDPKDEVIDILKEEVDARRSITAKLHAQVVHFRAVVADYDERLYAQQAEIVRLKAEVKRLGRRTSDNPYFRSPNTSTPRLHEGLEVNYKQKC